MVPHSVYRSAGDDAWVAIACRDDADWQALAALLDRADLAGLTTAERRAREAELDDVIGAWTAGALTGRGDGRGDRRRGAGAQRCRTPASA